MIFRMEGFYKIENFRRFMMNEFSSGRSAEYLKFTGEQTAKVYEQSAACTDSQIPPR